MFCDLKKCSVFGGLGDAVLLSWLDGVQFKPKTKGQAEVFRLFGKQLYDSSERSPDLLRAYLREVKNQGARHRLDYVRDLVDTTITRPKHNLTAEELRSARRELDRHGTPNCLIFPFASKADKTWRFNYWLDAAEKIQAAGIEPLFMVDGVQTVEADLPIPVVRRNIREVAALVHEADTVACNDSFALHLAGTLGTPLVAVLNSSTRRAKRGVIGVV